MVNVTLAIVALAGHLLLVAAALQRLATRMPLRHTLDRHRLLPPGLRGAAVAAGIEAVHLLTGLFGAVAFLAGGQSAWRFACLAAAVQYTGFAAYLGALRRRSGTVPCGCFGERGRAGGPAITRAVGFAAAAGLAAVLAPANSDVSERLVALAVAAAVAGLAGYVVAVLDAVSEVRGTGA
ncbi:MauE/DoxX family redox-associated membrane protein [Micromonospora sp. NPDC049366]|uniref:MauE/DoxX family redox-associated membrane protein n=1 Tax=Micromonospora sp. NPDC049366 TaxID=3364271 RepID=UPI0037925F63